MKKTNVRLLFLCALGGLSLIGGRSLGAEDPLLAVTNQDWGDPDTMDRQAVIERTMRPYAGESHRGVDVSSMTNKILCGYQGWLQLGRRIRAGMEALVQRRDL